MDKNTFLDELRKALHVLKDEEIQDIIGEYEQHIDLKVQNGLTVEQAIADFGNVKELVSEILEGYHVKAEFGVPDEENVVKSNVISSGRETIKHTIHRLWVWIGSIWSYMINGFRWCGKQLKRPFTWIKMRWKNRRTKDEIIPEKIQSNSWKEWIIRKMKGLGTMLLQLWNWMIRACVWCVRICWNCCVIGTALTTGVFGLMTLFTVGVLGVLLIQGYPLIGVTLACFGVVLCLFAATVLIWTMIWHRPEKITKEHETAEPLFTEQIELEEEQHA